MNSLHSELHRNILDVFNEYGFAIMPPAYEADPAAEGREALSPAAPPVPEAAPGGSGATRARGR